MSGSDNWDHIWAPHRKIYLTDEAGNFDENSCPFCLSPLATDEDTMVVVRGITSFVIMNKYPYSSGHVMVCTNRHVSLYDELTMEEISEIGELTAKSMRIIRKVSGCAGFNIGMNQGAVAGAGVAGHLHQHIVPRWSGDSNFMPIVAGTRVMPELIEQTRVLLSESWLLDNS
ncbi:MAG: HIT domain-containing protein [Actinobacteria bacterium]|uniref:Unannotated protein n=1 Tax=freshwater metagenome TaxID=449393 RepID=A0A6J5YVF8_9ZZZZ|nr:HIT domain-containing protein [Actinomycetota bacterium]